jgi:hypothetical protein
MNPLRRPQQAGAGDGAPSSVGGAPMSSGGADADLAWLRRLHQAGAGGSSYRRRHRSHPGLKVTKLFNVCCV